MTRDLTDHVRERQEADESAAELTPSEIYEMGQLADYGYLSLVFYEGPVKTEQEGESWTPKLISLVCLYLAQLEIIKKLAEMSCMAQGAATAATDFLYCEDCLSCQARHLVTTVERGRTWPSAS